MGESGRAFYVITYRISDSSLRLIETKILRIYLVVSQKDNIFAPEIQEIMIKVYETKEEKKAAFMRSVGLRKVWEDLTSGKMTFEEFKRQGYNTINITK